MSYNLFLDDVRQPTQCRDFAGDESIYDTEEFICVKSFDDFYKAIKENGIPKFVSFDYQILGDKTGLDCAEFLKFECNDQGLDLPCYRVHSGWPGIWGKFLAILEPEKLKNNNSKQ